MTPSPPQLRIALVLGAASAIAAACVFPYLLAVQPSLRSAPVPPAVLVATQSLQAGVACFLLGWAGLKLGATLGLGAPWLGAALYGRARPASSAWAAAALLGIAAGVAVVVAIALFGAPIGGTEATPPASFSFAMKGLLAAPYGAIAEEVGVRVFVMGLIAWLFARVRHGAERAAPRGRGMPPPPWVLFAAIVFAAVFFGAGHLPLAARLVPLTYDVVARVIAYNALGGLVFGWLYWKRGLEHAMLAHFFADVVLHAAAPLLAA